MGKPQNKIKIEWSPDFAYAIGLMVTDGNVSKDGRHLSFVSGELEMIELFQNTLNVRAKIENHVSGYRPDKQYYHIQLGDVVFCRFLNEIGIMPNKTKIISEVKVPDEWFADFLRGHFDGDGCFYSYFDKRWRSSFMYYLVFNSASSSHIEWLQKTIERLYKIKGHITKSTSCIHLNTQKRNQTSLSRKYTQTLVYHA